MQQALVAQRNAELRQAQLIAEVVTPAEAEAEPVRTLTGAARRRRRLSAEAAAAVQDRITRPARQRSTTGRPATVRADVVSRYGVRICLTPGPVRCRSQAVATCASGTLATSTLIAPRAACPVSSR